MEVASSVVIGIIPVIFLMILLPLALTAVLQMWLCKKGTKLGLILPGLSFFMSLLITLMLFLNMSYTSAGSTLVSCVDENGQTIVVEEAEDHVQRQEIPVQSAAMIGVVFFVSNIPTIVFLSIWLRARRQRIKVDDLKRMSIEDLE